MSAVEPLPPPTTPGRRRSESTVSGSQKLNTHAILLHTSNRNRYRKVVELVITASVPIITLCVVVGLDLAETIETTDQMNDLNSMIQTGVSISNIVGELQTERGLSSIYVSSDSDDRENPYENLFSQQNITDSAISGLEPWPDCSTYGDEYGSQGSLLLLLDTIRAPVMDDVDSVIFLDLLQNYTDVVEGLINCMSTDMSDSTGYSVPQHLLLKTQVLIYIIHLGDSVGLHRALGAAYFLKCTMDEDAYFWFVKLDGVADYLYDLIEAVMPGIWDDDSSQILALKESIAPLKDEILINSTQCVHDSEERLTLSDQWFTNMTTYLELIVHLTTSVSSSASSGIEDLLETANTDLIIGSLVVSLAVLICSFLMSLYMYEIWSLLKKVQSSAISIGLRTAALTVEVKRTDFLLCQLFPPTIALKLKGNDAIPPESFDNVTIYFSDIVQFTTICSERTPFQVVDILNHLYGLMDDLIDTYDVHKVETIGDAYMVVAGVPDKNETHASEIALMSLTIREAMKTCNVPHMSDTQLNIRIGIHTGAVVAGMAGHKMPKYSLFGDTVNTASRMESTGTANKIHISRTTKDHLDSVGNFTITQRGTIPVKGKGTMETFWLDGTSCEDSRNRTRPSSSVSAANKAFHILFKIPISGADKPRAL